MDVSPDLFRKVAGCFATGVTVVTTEDREGVPYGLTVNSFTSVSLDPPLVLICLDNGLTGLDIFLESGRFAVNILTQKQQDISNHFASRGTDRSQGPYAPGETGVPVVTGSMAWFECETVHKYAGGDHVILVGEVQAARLGDSDAEPLLFYRGRYRNIASAEG